MENKFPENDDVDHEEENEMETEDEDEDFLEDDEGLDLEEENEEAPAEEGEYSEEEEESEIRSETEKEAPVKKEMPPVKKTESDSPSATIATKDIPISLVIEVGRIQLSVEKLLSLQPGNLLELDVKPESGVDLVINGKCVGKGELLRVGETLGVRVLDLG